ncbi:MAG: linear amide C-N hydrolase, partial [Pontiellaceae bacterium]|nr:linear amide C-N hydrolase [Pontiellaceae bacterium]
MKKLKIAIVLSIVILFETNLLACTGFCISTDTTVFFGNNEDYSNPDTKIWYEPGSEGKYGRVSFGFDDFFSQGGMNEKGLCFDGFATKLKKVIKSPDKLDEGLGEIINIVMSECATVEDVLQLLSKYNLTDLET